MKRKVLTLAITLAVVFALAPASHAAAMKKPAQVKGVSSVSAGQDQISIKWKKVKKNTKGYAVYRNGQKIADVKKTSFTDTGLTPSTTYTYSVKAYNAQKKYFNSKTKKWVSKKPKKPEWKGKKQKTKYAYGKASKKLTLQTSAVNPGNTGGNTGSNTGTNTGADDTPKMRYNYELMYFYGSALMTDTPLPIMIITDNPDKRNLWVRARNSQGKVIGKPYTVDPNQLLDLEDGEAGCMHKVHASHATDNRYVLFLEVPAQQANAFSVSVEVVELPEGASYNDENWVDYMYGDAGVAKSVGNIWLMDRAYVKRNFAEGILRVSTGETMTPKEKMARAVARLEEEHGHDAVSCYRDKDGNLHPVIFSDTFNSPGWGRNAYWDQEDVLEILREIADIIKYPVASKRSGDRYTGKYAVQSVEGNIEYHFCSDFYVEEQFTSKADFESWMEPIHWDCRYITSD